MTAILSMGGRLLATTALALMLVVAGCGDDDEPSSGSSAAVPASGSPKLAERTSIKQLKVPYFGLEFIADEQGLFEKYNLDVEFVTQVSQGVAGVPAIVSNQVQTGQGFGVNTPLQARAGGAPVKGVLAGYLSTQGDYRFYSNAGSGITEASDLRGKRVGVVTLGAYPDIALQVWLQDNGVELDEVRRVQVPLDAMCEALLQDQIDVVGMYSLFWASCEEQNGDELELLFRDNDVLPSEDLYSIYVFTEDYIEQQPEVVRAYVAALKDAAAFAQERPEEAKQIISRATEIPAGALLDAEYPEGNCIDMDVAAEWVSVMEEAGAIDEGAVGPADWVTNEFNPDCA